MNKMDMSIDNLFESNTYPENTSLQNLDKI